MSGYGQSGVEVMLIPHPRSNPAGKFWPELTLLGGLIERGYLFGAVIHLALKGKIAASEALQTANRRLEEEIAWNAAAQNRQLSGGQSCQERISGEYEPRNPYADERDPGEGN